MHKLAQVTAVNVYVHTNTQKCKPRIFKITRLNKGEHLFRAAANRAVVPTTTLLTLLSITMLVTNPLAA